MASPMLETFCCMNFRTNDSIFADEHGYLVISISYNVLCIISSVMSICGASYQLIPRLPRRPPRGHVELESMLRQNVIICWLAIADLLASLGILVRSSSWINFQLPMEDLQSASHNATVKSSHLYCAVSSGWVHFFYICTYFWTLIYAVDMLRLVRRKSCPVKVYHAVCWGMPAIICFIGLFLLYYSKDTLICKRNLYSLVPHYLTTYILLCLVIIVNPILYSKTTAAVKKSMYNTGVYTGRERAMVQTASNRFRTLIVVFCVCWLPNVFNGLLILISRIHRKYVPNELFIIVIHITALLNPLQGFLNSIVYRGVGLCYQRFVLRRIDGGSAESLSTPGAVSSTAFTATNADETSPLMHSLRVS